MGRKLDQAVLLMRRGQLKWKGWEEAGAAVMRSTLPHAPPLIALPSRGGNQARIILRCGPANTSALRSAALGEACSLEPGP